MIYTLDELKRKIAPIARKYDIPAVYVFGSYARGEATDESDVDLLISRQGSKIVSLFDLGALYNDLNEELGIGLDLVTEDSLSQDDVKRRTPQFSENLR
ncbi:MAG: nucleotidyltransferase domain-containing protein, partial [Clostridiales bacterium]|nr:nucleotidyltransferase domain-containing protein [Clostridiales bacterium]